MRALDEAQHEVRRMMPQALTIAPEKLEALQF